MVHPPHFQAHPEPNRLIPRYPAPPFSTGKRHHFRRGLTYGNQLLLPFNLYPDGEAMRGWHQTVSGKPGERRVTFIDKSLTVSG